MGLTRCYNNKWILLFMMIPYFKPICIQYFSQLKLLETFFVIWKMAAALLIGVLLIIYMYTCLKIPRLIIMVSVFELSIILSTLYQHGYIQRAVIDAVSMAAVVSFLSFGMKFNCRGMLFLMSRLLSILMLVNMFSMLLYPGGLPADLYLYNAENPLFFMTVDNGSSFFLIFCMMVLVLEAYVLEDINLKRQMILIFFCMASAVLSHSGTSMLMVAMLAGLLVLIYWKISFTDIRWKTLCIMYGAAAAGVIFVPQSYLIQKILTTILHYTPDLSGRSLLWSVAVTKIRNHVWLGYGRTVQDYIPAWGGFYSSHNFWLELLLQGGLFALSLLLLTIIACFMRLEDVPVSKPVKSIEAAFLCMMFSAMMESTVHSVYIFGTMVFLYYSKYYRLLSEEKACGIAQETGVECDNSHL